ncbi:MAG: M18 family aminopeptidase [Sulfuricurvum sp. PD_MW2]|uniref:M18 family aminopeptidase n=1 Tax=Sulfuricurvum sp. PD_MW2 TaxID=2027917 RepID=UPI000C0608FA|nr:M18 family aminopeptidase [Sulfuricurvum sp. PD_MW2]PHM16594.1 MAG: M18 family aminopeptidase [Sulfuricurvum sp. PD_MW2]
MREFNEELIHFIDASPTPFHAVEWMSQKLHMSGFTALAEDEQWSLVEGKNYYLTRNGSSIIAFTYPPCSEKGYTIVGAHTDSPHLRLKPNPLTTSAGVKRFGVEPYGGVLLNPWFDRDLGLAGRVVYLDGESRKESLININRPIAMIPSLAIHLDREANSSRTINAQNDIVPIIATGEVDFETFILSHIQEDTENLSLLAHELSFYDTQKGSFIGIHEELIASARLDNLLSCFIGLKALIDTKKPMMCAFMDHEEVGSDSHVGAGGTFLEETLRRIAGERYESLMRHSLMVSCDNAHAQHPNFPGKHESEHAPLLNGGIAIKINSNQRYATSARTQGRFVQCAKSLNIPTQVFITRSDMGCGSTIGPITSTRLGVETIDVGIPQLAMHSIREVCGTKDAYGLYQILVQLGDF